MAIVVHIEDNSGSDDVPDPSSMRCWISAALKPHAPNAELSVLVVDEAAMTDFNHRYRHISKSTNVLSFPAELPDFIDTPLLGDIILCADVINREAGEQHKPRDAHWAHMLIHGSLHLLGFDHDDDPEAAEMEAEETFLVTALGFAPPYDAVEPAAIHPRD